MLASLEEGHHGGDYLLLKQLSEDQNKGEEYVEAVLLEDHVEDSVHGEEVHREDQGEDSSVPQGDGEGQWDQGEDHPEDVRQEE